MVIQEQKHFKLLSLAPDEWPRKKVAGVSNISEQMAKGARQFEATSGSLSLSPPYNRRDGVVVRASAS